MRARLIIGGLRLCAQLPLPIIYTLATVIGRWVARHPHFALTRITQLNIALCFPRLTGIEQATLVKHSLIETCKAFCELGALWLWPKEEVFKLVQQVRGEEYLSQALQQGRSVLLLTPHLGAWEMAGLYASSRYPMTALYRPPKLAGLHQLIHSARERAGGRFVATDHTGVRALYHALQRGEVVGILPDQVPHEANTGVFAPFFGVPAYTMVLVSRLARKTKAAVVFTYAERLPKGGFHIHFLPADSAAIAAPDLTVAAHALNQGIERCIQRCPAQYQWSYKRFKKRPPPESPLY